MDAELTKLRKISQLMRKQGLLHLKTSEYELSLSPVAVFHTDTPKTKLSADGKPKSVDLTDLTPTEQILAQYGFLEANS